MTATFFKKKKNLGMELGLELDCVAPSFLIMLQRSSKSFMIQYSGYEHKTWVWVLAVLLMSYKL